MSLGTVSACPKIQILGKSRIGRTQGGWPSLALSDLIRVTLGQDIRCPVMEALLVALILTVVLFFVVLGSLG